MDWILPALGLLGVATVSVATAVRAQRRDLLDPFHPLLFPAIYVTAATLLPVLWVAWSGETLGFVTPDSLTSRTPLQLTLAAAGFTAAAAIPLRRPIVPLRELDDNQARFIWWCGAGLLAMPAADGFYGVTRSAVLTRGAGQSTYTLGDTVGAALFIFVLTGAVLIGVGRAHQGRGLTALDWGLFVGLAALLGLNGGRGSALALIIIGLMFAAARHAMRIRTLVGATASLLGFAYAVRIYRSFAVGSDEGFNPIVVLLTDLGSVTFVTGWTDKLAPASEDGGTLLAALVYLIPRPIAIHLAPDMESGSDRFRELMNVPDGMGYGYAVVADGVLNFGTIGAFLVPALFGLAFSWAYARWNATATNGSSWIYPVLVASLPFAWRSDVLGATKGNVYPLVALVAVAWLVRRWSAARPKQAAGRG